MPWQYFVYKSIIFINILKFNQDYTNKHNKIISCVSAVERADRLVPVLPLVYINSTIISTKSNCFFYKYEIN